MAKLYLRKYLALSILLSSLSGWGQNTAELRGRVLNPEHHPVVSAFVIITGEDTSFMRAGTTDEHGDFAFPSLPVGSYDLEIKADGFPNFSSKNVRASIGRVVNLDVTLGEKESNVRAQASSGTSLVETGNAQLGVVMGEGEVTKLPLKSRDTFALLQLQPGVQSTLGADLFFGSDRPGVVSVSGGRTRSNNSSVNGGVSGDQTINFPSIQPSPDSVSEFRIISHNYDAVSGRNSGSTLNVITKSGGSNFHGSAYEFLRNNALNSKGYFDPTVPDFKQNEFGATLGGPIRHGRTFFFASYQGRREVEGIPSDPAVVPTQPERNDSITMSAPRPE